MKKLNEMAMDFVNEARETLAQDMIDYPEDYEDYDVEEIEDIVFTEYSEHDARAQYRDTTDDGDLTESIVSWLSMHGYKYECELTDDGYIELIVFNVR